MKTRLFSLLFLVSVALSAQVVVIDAGHGGKDPGSQAEGLSESQVNLQFAQLLQQALENLGATVVMTRSADDFVSLEERKDMANAAKADLVVSIHMGSARKGEGTTVYFNDPNTGYPQRVVESIQGVFTIVKTTSGSDQKLYLSQVNAPLLLLELGTMEVKAERDFWNNPAECSDMASLLAAAIVRRQVN